MLLSGTLPSLPKVSSRCALLAANHTLCIEHLMHEKTRQRDGQA
jgi:hypothetical protein